MGYKIKCVSVSSISIPISQLGNFSKHRFFSDDFSFLSSLSSQFSADHVCSFDVWDVNARTCLFPVCKLNPLYWSAMRFVKQIDPALVN